MTNASEGLIKYTPDFVNRWLADGAAGMLHIMPSIIGLVAYSWFVFVVIDNASALVMDALVKRTAKRWVTSAHAERGTLRARARAFAPVFMSGALDVWVGLPTLYILNLV